jgi:hypothetical protein
MSEYQAYIKAFGSDLRSVAVWEPGTEVKLGDFGQIRKRKWEHLGNILDHFPSITPELLEYTSSSLDRLNLGSAEVISTNMGAEYDMPAGNISMKIKFNGDNSCFVRADKCETRALKRVQAIAEFLVLTNKWERDWTFVNEVRSAERFLVLLGTKGGGEVQITASTSELLDEFSNGKIGADAGIKISGSKVLQFIGKKGPIHMSLIRLRSPLFSQIVRTNEVEFFDGKPSPIQVSIENITADEILAESNE